MASTRRVFLSVVVTSIFWFSAVVFYFSTSRSESGGSLGMVIGGGGAPKEEAPAGKRHVSKLGTGKVEGPVQLRPEDEAEKQAGYARHAFNQLVSDRTHLHRPIPDTRDPLCQSKTYPLEMPTASVIIIFHNEAWSTLFRTVHSVLDRSPPDLLADIVLYDDFSTHDDLKQKMDDYVATLPKVKVSRASKREGLIRARMGGAKAATGKILLFLDSHCEANVGWLEPLIERIHLNRKTVVCPVIDLIDSDNFRYSGSPLVRGGFNWGLHFKWKPIPQQEIQRRTDATDAIRSPTMAGGLFGLEKDYFYEIGAYDEEMDIWGGENLEISFRIWQCGGILEIIPCSRVGHVFRKRHPYTFPDGIDKTFSKNSMRVAEVWMDSYKKFYYATRPDLKGKDFGDISKRLALKEKLECKSFKWFLDTVYPELVVPDENVLAWGEVRNPDSALCLDTLGREEGEVMGLFYCHGGGGNQALSLTQRLELRHEEFCLDVARPGDVVRLLECHGLGGNQKWEHTPAKTLYHPASGQCLDRGTAESGGNVAVATCDGRQSQIWQFSQYFKKDEKKV